jgi:hypothetical protein
MKTINMIFQISLNKKSNLNHGWLSEYCLAYLLQTIFHLYVDMNIVGVGQLNVGLSIRLSAFKKDNWWHRCTDIAEEIQSTAIRSNEDIPPRKILTQLTIPITNVDQPLLCALILVYYLLWSLILVLEWFMII